MLSQKPLPYFFGIYSFKIGWTACNSKLKKSSMKKEMNAANKILNKKQEGLYEMTW